MQKPRTIMLGQERQGRSMGALDMMIAAHALTYSLTLITSDQAFTALRGMDVRNFRGS
jgi:tRNA(fMet)-specific endonuclease VapC